MTPGYVLYSPSTGNGCFYKDRAFAVKCQQGWPKDTILYSLVEEEFVLGDIPRNSGSSLL
jgi:hypothetical protein